MKAPLEPVTGFPQGVRAAFSLRGADPSHGASEGPYGRLNLGAKVGDRPEAVAINRELFERSLGAEAFWLSQVHGSRVVAVDEARLGKQRHGAEPPEADASVTALGGVALTVLMADCMPVLAASQDGRAIGAAHAGWRGLAGGVVEAMLETLCQQSSPSGLAVWLGPCIGRLAFEVQEDVRQAFLASPSEAFVPGRPGHYFANLPELARHRLRRWSHQSGIPVSLLGPEPACTFSSPDRFFSHRRDAPSGRMAASIWILRD